MRHRWPTLAAALPLAALLPFAACAPTPICARPEVLEEVARILREQDIYNRIDDHFVTEAPTTRPGTVTCQTVVRGATYTVNRGLSEPRTTSTWRRYDVTLQDNRFAVDVPR